MAIGRELGCEQIAVAQQAANALKFAAELGCSLAHVGHLLAQLVEVLELFCNEGALAARAQQLAMSVLGF
jgi:hypothetical protein